MKTSIFAMACGLCLATGPVGPAAAAEGHLLQLAQSGPPVRLAPREPEGGATIERPRERPGGIRVESLGKVNPESTGVLDERAGGLGIRAWSGTARSTVVSLLGRLPTKYRSATLRDLARRMLLSRAEAPGGLVVGQSLVAQRLDRLYLMGAVNGASALLKAAPPALSGPRLGQIAVNIAFLKGDAGGACKTVGRHMAKHDTAPLQQANVVCLALNKEGPKAMLALGLLREQEAVPDDTWEQLVEALAQGQKISVTSLKKVQPTHLAMMAVLKIALPGDVAETDDLAILRALAFAKDAPAEARLQAGETAARAGALSGAELGRVYAAVSIDADEVIRAVSMARKTFDARARARLFKAAAGERNPLKRARILRAVWSLARKHGGYLLAARVFAPFVADMAPNANLRRFAPEAARALYAAGEVQLATTWYRLLLDGPPTRSANALWPVARLAAPERILWDGDRLRAWAQAQRRYGRRSAARRVAILRVLLAATGDPEARSVDWNALEPNGAIKVRGGAIPRLWRGMRAAAVGGRVGETVLSVLTGVEDGNLSKLDHVDLRLVLMSLRDVRLTNELRAVALEAGLANGL